MIYVTTHGSLFDLIEWKDQNFLGLRFNLSANDFKHLQYLEEMTSLVSFFSSLKVEVSSAEGFFFSSVPFFFHTNFITSLSMTESQTKVVWLFVLTLSLGCAFPLQ